MTVIKPGLSRQQEIWLMAEFGRRERVIHEAEEL
jgi:hypothetical protein